MIGDTITHFTFLGKVTEALSDRTALVKIGTYDCVSPVEPQLDQVKVYLNNLNAPQTIRDLQNAELEITIGALPVNADETVYGVFRQINHVEKFITEDYLTASMEKISRKHLEAFLKNVKTCDLLDNGNILLQCKVTSRFEREFVWESLPVEVSFRNDRAVVKLHVHQKANMDPYPVIFNTRTHVMKATLDDALIIMGESVTSREFVVWLRCA